MRDIYRLAKEHLPHLLFNENEPFFPKYIFYSVFNKGEKNISGNSKYRINFKDTRETVIEYAIYYTYDIQHLYDLEHVYVYIDKEDNVVSVVSSFHGKFFNSIFEGYPLLLNDKKAPTLYVQPGKHAMMPEVFLFQLFENYDESCNIESGIEGLHKNPLTVRYFDFNKINQDLIKNYIKEKYSFSPSILFNKEKNLNSFHY
jgi:hypothetical protein